MENVANITAWFVDAATRHPDILHSTANKRFFELEWDEMMQSGAALAAEKWTLAFEDYTEQVRDNDGDYLSIIQVLAFQVVKHVPQGDAVALHANFVEGRRIAKSIVAKMKADELDGCDADVPAGVTAPRLVDLSAVTFMPMLSPYFDHAAGCRCTVRIRTDHEVTFSRNEVAWMPLT